MTAFLAINCFLLLHLAAYHPAVHRTYRCRVLTPTIIYSGVLALRIIYASILLAGLIKEKDTIYMEIVIVVVFELLPLFVSVSMTMSALSRETENLLASQISQAGI